MNSAPRLSVVIATYNRPSSLQRLLRQLAEQSVAPERYEVVVVDDGSAIPVAPQLAGLQLPYALRVERQENAGAAAARHRGVMCARGEFLLITDDDMQVGPDFLERHLELHAGSVHRVVLGRIAADGAAQLPLFERWHQRMLDAHHEQLARGAKPVLGRYFFTGNVSLRRSDYLRVGGFDRAFGNAEDAELGVRLEKAGVEFVYASKAVVRHGSDHAELEGWRRRNVRYGHFDHRIAQKHPDDPELDPWRYAFELNPLSRPLVLGAALAPAAGELLAGAAYAVGSALERAGLERPAMAAVTLTFGLDYFRGLREELGSPRAVALDLRRYTRVRVASRLRRRLGVFAEAYDALRMDQRVMHGYERRYGHADPAAGEGSLAHDLVHRIGLQVLAGYRLMRALHASNLPLGAKVVSRLVRHLYGSDIHWEAELAPGVVLVHGMGLSISHAARVGPGCILFQHVTLGMGADPDSGEPGAPDLREAVHVGPGVTLIGPVTVGRESKLAPGVVVTRSVPPRSVVEAAAPRVRPRAPRPGSSAETQQVEVSP